MMSTKKRLEKDYYPIVAKWLAKKYQCFKTDINSGLLHNRADVIGVRDTGGDLSSEIETIIIDVKRNHEPFSTASGPTFGYTIYANRVYLADIRSNGFTRDEIKIANHLGIGLIQIGKNNECSEILTSPYYKPLTKYNEDFLRKLRLGKCRFCDTYFNLGSETNNYENVTRENIKKSLNEDRGLLFWHKYIYTKNYQ